MAEQLNEKELFRSHYASLCNTLTDINSLLPYFVQENIITPHDEAAINAITRPNQKVRELLLHISGPLTSGDAKGFYTMLTIMKEHGNQSTHDLGVRMSHDKPDDKG